MIRIDTVLSLYVVLLGCFAAFGQPLAGLVYESRLVFLGIYLVRESWLFLAIGLLVLMTARVTIPQRFTPDDLLAVTMFISIAMFVLLIGLAIRTPGLMITFLQFRNLFGFALAIIFVSAIRHRFDTKILFGAGAILAWAVCAYTYVEVVYLIKSGVLISNEVFNKLLLEQAKGTRADVGGGFFQALRIPGPLFNPSQLGVFAVYLIYAGTCGSIRFGKLLLILLIGLAILGISKSAFIMLFMLVLLRMAGRQVGLVAVLGLLFAPFLLDYLALLLTDYHIASISRHFEGYMTAVGMLAERPFGMGVGAAGELASTLGGFEASAGYESGMGTVLTNLGLFGLMLYAVIGAACFFNSDRIYFDFFALWSVSMFFNESAMSPHLFVFQMCLAASLVQAVHAVGLNDYSERVRNAVSPGR